jgi:L-methionine (R)-S-oxide reductase
MEKQQKYTEVTNHINSMIDGENDLISIMSTIVCKLKYAFDSFSWVGFYRVTEPGILKVGPYQGAHGCLKITFDRGVCGKCATERKTQVVADVNALPYYIACSGETQSEIVVPVFNKNGELIALLDIDSTQLNNFDNTDVLNLENICGFFKVLG